MGMRRAYGCDMPVRLRISQMVTPVTIGGVRYESQRAAIKATGLHKSTIYNMRMRGWETKRLDPRKRYGEKSVLHVESGAIFNSLQDAAKEMGCSPSHIGQMLKGGREWRGFKLLNPD